MKYCYASISRISPYFTMFFMFHNAVHFIVQHQVAPLQMHLLHASEAVTVTVMVRPGPAWPGEGQRLPVLRTVTYSTLWPQACRAAADGGRGRWVRNDWHAIVQRARRHPALRRSAPRIAWAWDTHWGCQCVTCDSGSGWPCVLWLRRPLLRSGMIMMMMIAAPRTRTSQWTRTVMTR